MDAPTGQISLWKAAVGTVFALLLVQLILRFRKVYFGPLSRFPGPRLYALTNLAGVYDKIRGNEVSQRGKLHERYGPVVRTGPDTLSFNTAGAFQALHSHRIGGKQVLQKDMNFYGLEPLSGVRSIIDSDDENHARMRRILSHSFSDRALKQQESLFKVWANLLVQKLHEHTDMHSQEATDMVKRWNCATFDIMGDLTFAESLGMLEGGEYVPWVKTIFDSVKIGTQLQSLLTVPVVGSALRSLLKMMPGIRKVQAEHMSYSVERVRKRMARTDLAHPDLWTEVIKRGEKYNLTMPEMEANGNLFMVAGTETTATLLSGLTFYLVKDQDKLAKLAKEIRDTFDTTASITIEKLQGLPYLHACVEEGLRIYPPVPVGLPRLTPPEGVTIDNEFVPGGMTVSVSHWAAYHSEKNFACPNEFHPERWLPDNDRFQADVKAALQPFSLGPRNCIGQNLAYHEIRLLLASVLLNFDLELDPRSSEWHGVQKVYNLWEKVPLWIKLHPVQK